MCWHFRVYLIVIESYFIRFYHNIRNICRPRPSSISTGDCESDRNSVNSHDYIVISEIDVKSKIKKVETEPYYRTVNRSTAEEILISRVDGSCLVRPYKEMDICIKYIVSIYAQENFFHLYIRQIQGVDNKFGIGLQKPLEKLFNAPSDIINYYRLNKLLCTNKQISLSLVLVPIS